jgi:hypothetical protein
MSQSSKPSGVQNVFPEVRHMINSGYSDKDIEANLVERGVNRDEVRSVIGQIRQSQQSNENEFRGEAFKQMAIGAVIAIIGIIVTFVTYSIAASSSGGGSYVVAWGAIAFGGWRFFRGLMLLVG